MTRDLDSFDPTGRPVAGGSQEEYRQRLAALRAEALKRRENELREQRSPANSAADRIRIWERRHQLQLPQRSDHQHLAAIAADIGLSLEDVQAEQQLRLAARSGTRRE